MEAGRAEPRGILRGAEAVRAELRCSNCSEVVRPILALDIDGTLADYHGHFMSFARAYFNWDEDTIPSEYGGTYPFREFVCLKYGITEPQWRDLKLAYRQGGQKRSQPIRSGAHALMRAATRLNVEVWLCTTRPYQRLDNIDPDTRYWLEYNDIFYYGLLYDDDKYEQLGERVDRSRVVMALDDLYEQYDKASAVFGADVPILVRNGWNNGVLRPNAVKNLYDAATVLQFRIEEWSARTAG